MKKFLLLFSTVLFLNGLIQAQTLYTNTTASGFRYNPGLGQLNTPKAAFDDVEIPSATVAGSDSIRITKVKVGIVRLANAPATNVNIYYSNVDDTATGYSTLLSIPPVLLGTVSLPANGATAGTTVISVGDSISTLFRVKTDTGNVFSGFQTFFIGVSLSQPSSDNGVSLTSGPGANFAAFWLYNSDSTVKRVALAFNGAPSTFYIQAFGYPVGGSLPVTFTNFSGERKNGVNILNWTTATEQNNTGFELQRSVDGINFSKLVFVSSKASNGNSNNAIDYTWSDSKPLAGSGYYRLKQIDKDGKSTVSNVVLLKGNPVKGLTISSIYPNPVTDLIKVIATTTNQQTLSISITDLAGKTVSTQTQQTTTGDNFIQVNTALLPKGSYMLKVQSANGEVSTQKFIKQ